ncbi:MAG TPA: hypothetical protein VHI13_04950 [Candidatus Kapabacteria bacterium]|nr:hypothetical protein [Candidatus Kapabacteria bacterium]
MREKLRRKLSGGDRRSTGRADEVVRDVLARPELFADLIEGLDDADPLVRMRCADAAEKVTREHPEYLLPHRRRCLQLLGQSMEQEGRWHLAQMVPRLRLTRAECVTVVEALFRCLADRSSIVRTLSMQALADLSANDSELRARVLPLMEHLTVTGTPAMRARGRRLLKQLRELDVRTGR